MASLRACDTPQPLGLPRPEGAETPAETERPNVTTDGDLAAADRGLIEELTSLVSAAGAAILEVRAGSLEVRSKSDHSPVTAADHAAEAVLLAGIARALPGVPVVSEEACGQAPPRDLPDSFVLVDPLDGTRELLAGRDEFTVNVALLRGGRPHLGIVAAPAQALIWRGIAGLGAERLRLAPGHPAAAAQERRTISTRPRPRSGLVAVVSRSHLDPQTEAFLAKLPVAERLAGGSAIKFCQVAEGAADVYPRLSTTCEWDVAAGHAVLTAAGGAVTTPDGAPLAYGRVSANFRVPSFVAWGRAEDR
jgi:3'(2'), 5'-bisphosphate nucleotidase